MTKPAHRTFLIVAVATLLAVLPLSLSAQGSPADHVVLISFDGLRPEFYLDETWPTPMLQEMSRQGSHAVKVRSVFPSVTYPAHTTMITGVSPAAHGIYYNSPFEPQGATGRWYWEEEHIQVETLWDAARRAGLKTASVFWPVSVGGPIDWNVPEIWPLQSGVDFLDPIRQHSQPPDLLAELEREATGRLSSMNFSFGHLSLDDKSSEMAAYLLAAYKPSLLTIHLIGADNFQHDEGREGPMVTRSVAAMDRCIARLTEAAEQAGILERTTFLVVGDHGFIELETEVAPNVWLVEAGLMEAQADRGDWKATVHNTSVAGFLFLQDEADAETLAVTTELLEAKLEEVGPLFRILDRAELAELEGAPDAALGLTPAPGVYVSSRSKPPALKPISGASHGYLPEIEQMHTGFIAWGAGIRGGGSVPLLELEQVAPLIARLLGVELPAAQAPVPDILIAD